MVNSAGISVCTRRTQSVHNVYVRFAVNEQKQKVNGSQKLTKRINQSLTSEVLV
jgi:hypothetical protein